MRKRSRERSEAGAAATPLPVAPPPAGAADRGDGDRLPLVGPAHLRAQSWYVLNKAAQRAREMVEAALAPFGLKRRHYGALGVLGAEGPQNQQGLAARVPVDRATLVALVDDLERLGLAERRQDPKDRRAYRVAMTRAGARVLAEADGAVAAAEARALAPLSAAERALLVRLANRLCGWEPVRADGTASRPVAGPASVPPATAARAIKVRTATIRARAARAAGRRG